MRGFSTCIRTPYIVAHIIWTMRAFVHQMARTYRWGWVALVRNLMDYGICCIAYNAHIFRRWLHTAFHRNICECVCFAWASFFYFFILQTKREITGKKYWRNCYAFLLLGYLFNFLLFIFLKMLLLFWFIFFCHLFLMLSLSLALFVGWIAVDESQIFIRIFSNMK